MIRNCTWSVPDLHPLTGLEVFPPLQHLSVTRLYDVVVSIQPIEFRFHLRNDIDHLLQPVDLRLFVREFGTQTRQFDLDLAALNFQALIDRIDVQRIGHHRQFALRLGRMFGLAFRAKFLKLLIDPDDFRMLLREFDK